MAELTQERVRELFDYDAENGILLKILKNGKQAVGNKPTLNGRYGQVMIDGKKYLTHRVIWVWHYGSWPDGEIDHINRNKMDNRIENLRVVTSSENKHNLGLRRDNSSGYTGVYWFKRDKKYVAYIVINKKQINLGYYTTAEEAYLAYMLAKIKHHPTSPIAQEYLRELTLAG